MTGSDPYGQALAKPERDARRLRVPETAAKAQNNAATSSRAFIPGMKEAFCANPRATTLA
jgi:hypothetical protein